MRVNTMKEAECCSICAYVQAHNTQPAARATAGTVHLLVAC
jgi:hypothetical protein